MSGTEGRRRDDQRGFRAVRAIRDAVPTRRHAEMLFDMVVDILGEESWIETANGGAIRTLFRREAAGSLHVVPWPLLSVSRGGRDGPSPLPTGVPGVFEEPPKRPGPAPRLRGLGPGELNVHDGPHRATVTYGGDGRWFETCRSASPEALSGVVPALAARTATPVELVADYVASLDPGRHGPGRVFLPVPLPGGARGAWNCGLFAIREALFDGGDPGASGFMAADGWTGRARACGATREAALSAWREEVARVRPFPVKPKPPPEPLPEPSVEHGVTEGGFYFRGTLRGPSSDVPRVEPEVENSPAAVLPVGGRPGVPAPVGIWTRLVGCYGTVVPVALRWEPEGFTLIGDRLLDGLDLLELEERLAAADRDAPELPARPAELGPKIPLGSTRVRTYRFAAEVTGAPLDAPAVSTSWSRGFHARDLDADRLREAVVRMRAELD